MLAEAASSAPERASDDAPGAGGAGNGGVEKGDSGPEPTSTQPEPEPEPEPQPEPEPEPDSEPDEAGASMVKALSQLEQLSRAATEGGAGSTEGVTIPLPEELKSTLADLLQKLESHGASAETTEQVVRPLPCPVTAANDFCSSNRVIARVRSGSSSGGWSLRGSRERLLRPNLQASRERDYVSMLCYDA